MAASPKLQSQVERAVRDALIASIREDRNLTVDKLIALRKDYPEVGTITIGELTGGRGSGKKGRGGSRRSQAVDASDVDTRSAIGRDAYDEAVLGVVDGAKGKKVSAQDIRRTVGGTPEQARRSLNRLIAGGKLNYSGKARATRYHSK